MPILTIVALVVMILVSGAAAAMFMFAQGTALDGLSAAELLDGDVLSLSTLASAPFVLALVVGFVLWRKQLPMRDYLALEVRRRRASSDLACQL